VISPTRNSSNVAKIDFAILAALPEEIASLVPTLANYPSEVIKMNDFELTVYHYKAVKIVIVYTGIGLAFMANAATLVKIYFNPEFVFLCGTAGSINKKLKIGDVVIADKAFEAEMLSVFNTARDTPFKNCFKHPLKQEFFPEIYPADKELLAMISTLKFSSQKNIYQGTLVSSTAFPAPPAIFQNIKYLNPYAIDMETSAFYQMAWLLNMRVLNFAFIFSDHSH
jgi:purine-nucleoside phosphorylase